MGRNSFEIHPALVYLFVVSFSKEKSTRLDKELKHGLCFLFFLCFLLKEKKNCPWSLNIYTTKRNVTYSKIWFLFKNLDWWWSEGFRSHKFQWIFSIYKRRTKFRKFAKSLYIFLTMSEKVENYVLLNTSDNFAMTITLRFWIFFWSRIITD